MGAKAKTQYATRENSKVYHIVVDGKTFCSICNLGTCEILDKEPIWLRLCAFCGKTARQVTTYTEHVRAIKKTRTAGITETAVDHVVIFSHSPEHIEGAVKWAEGYRTTKPDNFGSLMYIVQFDRMSARAWYAASDKAYSLSLPLLGADDYYQSEEWKKLRRKVLARDKSCVLCGNEYALAVHHKTYERFGHEKLEDLSVLCGHCHRRFHSYK